MKKPAVGIFHYSSLGKNELHFFPGKRMPVTAINNKGLTEPKFMMISKGYFHKLCCFYMP
ncbi:hypothetical protein JOC75_003733 [Metabacillus crassostreae]|uniref:hypothetical protein n=1 Tax=Metabacillus crassostreae TaxID=929098 RepID=UPI00195CA2B2|nr:hypothetical protein [Metabacillus crassostreae]MBM7605707.1 hypothetical protein [Metabacillus crassostreae]